MGLFGKKEDKSRKLKVMSMTFEHVEGLPYPVGFSVILWTPEKNFTILPFREKKKYPRVELGYDQIKEVEMVDEKQILDVDKSVIGRAVAGGILLGGLGATIGAISGVGTKKKSVLNRYLVINYTSSESQEIKVMSFKALEGNFPTRFVREIKARAGLEGDKESDAKPLETLHL